MNKFIEVHDKDGGFPMLVNLRHVLSVYERGNASCMETETEVIPLAESYEEVKRMIGSAQGGIPMERSEQY